MRVWILLLVLSGVANAQPVERDDESFIDEDLPSLEIDDCPPAPASNPTDLNRIGSEHFERGENLYVQGDYRGAVSELVASYCIIPFYTILKDIGQSYERELDYRRAIAYLRRYVLAIPKDAKRRTPCDPDPQEDKKNVIARINVLGDLRAKVLVRVEPSDAKIQIVKKNGKPVAYGESGKELEVRGGNYQILIRRDGFVTATEDLHAEIGKPYTFFEQLDPVKGRLHVSVIPGDARIFLDDKYVGTGTFEAPVPNGKYKLSAEAPDRQTWSREIDVLGDQDATFSFELAHLPEYGRNQLLIYGGIAGGAAGALLAQQGQNQTQTLYGGIAFIGGVGAGLLGVYFGTPRHLALGTSSLTVTASLMGGVIGGALSQTTGSTSNQGAASPLIGGGLVIGAVAGYYVGDRTHPSPGDAAVINSGAVWGSVAGGLLAVSFARHNDSIGAGLVLSGLGMGALGGVLLQRYFTVSRARAALIDASAVIGLVLGLASENVVTSAGSTSGSLDQEDERKSNFALGGLTAGLIIGGVLTRHMDEPKLAVTPVVNKSNVNGVTTTTIGIGGAF